MEKEHKVLGATILLILAGYYAYLDAQGPQRETLTLRETNRTPNILNFEHSGCEDCIDLRYTIGNRTFSDPDPNGTHWDIKYVRKSNDALDRMLKGRYDGYFSGDDWQGILVYHIWGVVVGNTCYYNSEKITFWKLFYGTTYHREGNLLIFDHHLSWWRYFGQWLFILGILWLVIRGEPDGTY